MNIQDQIQRIHNAFCAATGVQLRMGLGEFNRERGWADFLRSGFTADDMLSVVRYLQREIRECRRNPGALKWSNCIGDLVKFEEDLQQAKAAQRMKKATPLDRVRAMRERPVNGGTPALTPNTAKPVADYIAALRQAAS